jgi:hypothetical protein
MKMNRFAFAVAVVLLAALLAAGCARYDRKVVPFRMPDAYPNMVTAAGAAIAAEAFSDSSAAHDAFGFDILGAGVMPVQVVFDNRGGHSLEIIPERTYLVDRDRNLWPVLEANLAYDRIAKKTRYGEVAPRGATSGLLGAAGGAIIGAAVGIVTGENVGEAAGKGAAVGGAAGAVMGGAGGVSDGEVRRQIGEDLHTRNLERKPVPPGDVAHGFIFFPGEANKPAELRLSLRETDTGTVHSLVLAF